MDNEGVSVSVGDGFAKSFAPSFLSRFGAQSLFVRTVSDFLTLGLARMLREKGRLGESDPVALFSDAEALDVLRALTRAHPSLKQPLFQEPLGYATDGAIAESFDALFDAGTFGTWLAAFEVRAFDRCRAVTQPGVRDIGPNA